MKGLKAFIKQLAKYPSAIFGIFIVLLLVVAAVVVMIKIPYQTAIDRWRGGEEVWGKNPRNVPPKWVNWFKEDKLVESLMIAETDEDVTIEEIVTEGGTKVKTTTYSFNFESSTFPQDLVLYFTSTFETKQPFVSIKLITPDEREIKIGSFAIGRTLTFPFSQDEKLLKRLDGVMANIGLFILPEDESQTPIKGIYQIEVEAIAFEENSSVESEFVLTGQLYGWAGTDHLRRDLTLPLMWGIPIALAFGLLAAVGTSVLTMAIAAVGAWYGGWVDGLIQRITEINIILPFLSILIMIGTFYSRSIWTILGATIALSIFTGGIKFYRATFIQIKESTYIEAARAYGAKDGRIIFRYLVPRIIPLLIPGLVSAVPAFVFLEASLALLGIGDPVIPTWGKTINEAYGQGALYRGWYYWILEPAALLMLTGLGFAMLGFALDRIFNPRLRGM
ncbi:MAG: ABC transporter permease [Anaerolineaceae bacterium]|nr:ABC transporter permease [Anaerolineaceae bacterium]